MIQAAQVFESALRQPACQVAGPVQTTAPLSGGDIGEDGHKSFRRQVGPIDIPTRQAHAPDMQLTRHTHRHRLPGLIQQAKEALFELQNLSVGKVAPEIAGEDLDGKKFKLTDYRGKVIVLDFWGHW